MRLNWPLAAVVFWELAWEIGRLAVVLHEHQPSLVSIGLSIGRIALTMGLGWLALSEKVAWAGWIFAGLQYLGAGAMAFLSVFSLEDGAMGFYPIPFAFFVLYLALGIAATYGVVREGRQAHPTAELSR